MKTERTHARGFRLGSVFITTHAMGQLNDDDVFAGLTRHASCDWGDLCAEDKEANDAALRHGARLLSAYRSTAGVKFWIITEWDRSSTTVLLPEDY